MPITILLKQLHEYRCRNQTLLFLECNNLYQIIDEPTRITASRESILDLIISDSPGTLSPPANCDHNLIFATLSFPVNKKRSYRRRIWKFNGVNEDALNNALFYLLLFFYLNI